MNVPNNLILIWTGTHAAIPSGYTRETSLDATYPKGTADVTDPNGTGGATTHTHTSSAHSHTMTNHTHTYQLSGSDAGGGNTGSTPDASFNGLHHHTGTTGSATGGGLSSITSTYDTVSNDPPYYSVIYIKSNGTNQAPSNTIGFFDNATLPSGWSFCDGSSSTTDLRNKYLKGAATSADAGATGGSTTNTHALTHSHTVSSHGHGSSTSSGPLNNTNRDARNNTSDLVENNHTHTVTFNSTTDTLNSTAPSIVTAETVEPAFTRLIPIQNKTGTNSLPIGLIGLWLGSLISIPVGWTLCDGTRSTIDMRGKYLKCANTTADAGLTGGANTHTHASQGHTHSASGSHGHTGSVSVHVGSSFEPEGSGHAYFTTTAPNHTIASISSETCTYSTDNTTADSSSNEPPYRTVAFIKFDRDIGGSFIYNMLQ